MKRIERQLRLQQNYAQSIVESVPEPLLVVDDGLRVLSASPSFWERFGFDPEDGRGRPLDDLDGRTWDIPELRRFARADREATTLHFDVLLESEDGETSQFAAHAERITEHGRATDRILLFLRDVTQDRRRDQSRDEEARRKDWFLAMLGHEIRNPLAPIRNALDLLKHDGTDPKYKARLLDIVERQLDQLTKLVNDVLDVSRITGGKLPLRTGQIDLVEVVSQFAEDHRADLEHAGLDLAVEHPDRRLIVEADATRIAQAVSNLLINARRYTPRGGRIRLRIRREGSHASVSVTDTGIGMTRELVRQVFEPFHKGPRGQDAEQGLGVGLTLVRAIVEEHGGDVRAESPGPGRGATFTIRLPLVRAVVPRVDVPLPESPAEAPEENELEDGGAQAATGAEPSAPPAEETPDRRVLLVEDMPDTAETASLLLEAIGCDVLVATTGEDALARIWDWEPDVVLSDIGLPGAMNGFDVARAIRANPAGGKIHLLALTGYGRESDRADALSAGFDGFLVKPVRMEEMREVLERVGKTEDPELADS